MKSIRPTESSSAGFKDHSPGAVAKNNAGGAIGVVDDRRHNVGANHENSFMRARGDELRAGLHGIDKCGAGGGEVESPNPGRAQLVLHQAGGGGKKHIGRDGADDDGVDVVRREPALSQGFLRRLDREVAGGHSFFDNVPFANSDAGENPVIGGVDHFLQVGVGEKARWNVSAKGADLRSDAGRCGQ